MSCNTEILLVEDNPLDAELAIRVLNGRKPSHKILHVHDGQAALDHLFGNGDDGSKAADFAALCLQSLKVVLLDLKLPKVDGLGVLRRIRSNVRTRMLPVVILTSSREERDLVETYHLGANSYIVKPVDFTEFSEALNQLGLYWCVLNVPAPSPQS